MQSTLISAAEKMGDDNFTTQSLTAKARNRGLCRTVSGDTTSLLGPLQGPPTFQGRSGQSFDPSLNEMILPSRRWVGVSGHLVQAPGAC